MQDQALRKHLGDLLGGGGAHLGFDEAVADLPPALRGKRPPNIPHTPWRLVEHMRIAQWDILEFCRNATRLTRVAGRLLAARRCPAGRAGMGAEPRAFRADLDALQRLVADPAVDLLARLPHGTGQTVLREALLAADHNAYHLGQLVAVRRALGAWPNE